VTDKVEQYAHQQLSTFGIGAEVSEARWRGVIRQLIALGHVSAEGEFNTLSLAESARDVLRGESEIRLRVQAEGRGRKAKSNAGRPGLQVEDPVLARLKTWRSATARTRNVPAYIVFNDATLLEMASERPQSLLALGAISGVGAKKLDAYGEDLLALLTAAV
jgi:ATP-dependent DNA helicase RecQ